MTGSPLAGGEVHEARKNKLRWLRMSQDDVEWAILHPVDVDCDEEGRPRYLAEAHSLLVHIVLALDEPDLVVTVYRKGR